MSTGCRRRLVGVCSAVAAMLLSVTAGPASRSARAAGPAASWERMTAEFRNSQIQELSRWLEEHPAEGSLTPTEWSALSEFGRTMYVSGLLRGTTIAQLLDGSDDPRVDERKRLYLLNGWRMSPDDYITEVSAQLAASAAKRKSIVASFIAAEAGFARSAGQPTRAERLEAGARELLRVALRVKARESLLSEDSDGAKQWHFVVGASLAMPLTRGILDGVALERARVEAGLTKWAVSTDFRVGQIRSAMDAVSADQSDGTSAVAFYVGAIRSLREKARAR